MHPCIANNYGRQTTYQSSLKTSKIRKLYIGESNKKRFLVNLT